MNRSFVKDRKKEASQAAVRGASALREALEDLARGVGADIPRVTFEQAEAGMDLLGRLGCALGALQFVAEVLEDEEAWNVVSTPNVVALSKVLQAAEDQHAAQPFPPEDLTKAIRTVRTFVDLELPF